MVDCKIPFMLHARAHYSRLHPDPHKGKEELGAEDDQHSAAHHNQEELPNEKHRAWDGRTQGSHERGPPRRRGSRTPSTPHFDVSYLPRYSHLYHPSRSQIWPPLAPRNYCGLRGKEEASPASKSRGRDHATGIARPVRGSVASTAKQQRALMIATWLVSCVRECPLHFLLGGQY